MAKAEGRPGTVLRTTALRLLRLRPQRFQPQRFPSDHSASPPTTALPFRPQRFPSDHSAPPPTRNRRQFPSLSSPPHSVASITLGACPQADGSCACDAGWQGTSCSVLKIAPVNVNSSGYRHHTYVQWARQPRPAPLPPTASDTVTSPRRPRPALQVLQLGRVPPV